MFNKPKFLTIILTLTLLTVVSCTKEIVETPQITSENKDVPEHIWNVFNEQQQIEINKTVKENDKCGYFIEEFDIEFWEYPIYNENGTLIEIAYPIFGLKADGENSFTNFIFNQKVQSNLVGEQNSTFETGKANINYWTQNGFGYENNQLMINVSSLQKDNFDLATNEQSFYINNGTGNFKNMNGFSYAKIEVEQKPVFGCYPNNSNFPDDFEDGTCADNFNCSLPCDNAAGKGKIYLIGFICNK